MLDELSADAHDQHRSKARAGRHEELAARFATEPPRVPGFLIRDHGLTAWGRDADAALNHVEFFEYSSAS